MISKRPCHERSVRDHVMTMVVLVTLAQGRRGVAGVPLHLASLASWASLTEVSLLGRGRGEGAEAALVLPEYWTLIGHLAHL